MSALVHRLPLQYPIISAPMAVIAGADLACAVSAAGGLGLIGGGYCDEPWIRQQLALTQGRSFGIGFITWRLHQFQHLLPMALQYKPSAVMLSFGDISPFVEPIKAAQIPLICQVQTSAQAREVKQQGADVIVAQGTEAGGHGGSEPLLTLLDAVLNVAGDIPVLAAGGLVDGQDIKTMLGLGAEGVLMGTRFYATAESLGSNEQKQRILTATADETVRTRVYDYARGYNWPKPYTGRALKTAFYEKWHQCPDMFNAISEEEQAAYALAAKQNNFDIAGIFVGEGVGRITDIPGVAQLMQRLTQEAGLA